jgi:hypothetical protein
VERPTRAPTSRTRFHGSAVSSRLLVPVDRWVWRTTGPLVVNGGQEPRDFEGWAALLAPHGCNLILGSVAYRGGIGYTGTRTVMVDRLEIPLSNGR